jgi:hypothetical protein
VAGTKSRYSIGNIIAAVMVMIVCGVLAVYAMFDDSSTRIGRNSEFVTAFGALGVVIAAGIVIIGIRSRRR